MRIFYLIPSILFVAMWNNGINPGEKFDAIVPLPALQKMVKEGAVPNGRALVPGCGRGYDVTLLASPDRVVVGLDISTKAIEAAEEGYASMPDDIKPPRSSVQFLTTSFFDMPEDAEEKFDFIYDYTFFCALHPSVRQDWANKMAALVAPGGELCTIMFPLEDDSTKFAYGPNGDTPPFRVTVQDYTSILEPLGFENFLLEKLSPELAHPGRNGLDTNPNIPGGLLYTSIGRWRMKA